jgi:chromosome segregation ATPase
VSESTLIGRLSRFFRKQQGNDLPLDGDHPGGTEIQSVDASRSSFLRPWAKRDQAISNLQQGFTALTDLMTSVRDNLERQSQRQDELLEYMSHLPQALQSLPESNRVQSETLKAIHMQLATQTGQANKLGEILEKLSHATAGSRETLDELRERVDDLSRHDQRISDTLGSVGNAMQDVSKTSQTSASVLQQVRDNINHRDGQLERILLKQNTRFTTLLTIAILLSVAALGAVVVFGYLMWQRGVTP